MEKLDMQSMNVTAANVEKIAALFPSCVAERLNGKGVQELAIDFDKLRMELGADVLDESEERYQFTWPDKREAIRLSNARTTMTLRPCREESVDFDNTENLYIEGDNLEVLKVLQQNYLGKVKMIYIDPPYNTGGDFIYKDKRVIRAEDYKNNSGQYDAEGNRLVKNTESNGRFHTDWLNFMYPRLKVARNLLSDKGLIFISIDDNEYDNLKKICDEIFGANNFINAIAINMNSLSGVKMTHAIKGKRFPAQKEMLLLYKKTNVEPNLFIDKLHKRVWDKEYNMIIPEMKINDFPSFQELDIKSVNKKLSSMHICSLADFAKSNGIDLTEEWKWENAYRIFGTKSNRALANKYREEQFSQDIIAYINDEGNTRFFIGNYNRSVRDPRIELVNAEANSSVFLSDNWTDISNDGGVAQEGDVPYPNGKKPLQLINRILKCANLSENDIVIDFFAGSSTTAHSSLLTSLDLSKLRFIMVQYPENLDESLIKAEGDTKRQIKLMIKFLDSIAKPHFLSEIGKERIRRAGAKIKAEHENVDTGFRVLKVDESNMKNIYYTPGEVQEQDIWDSLSNIKEDRTPEDLLFQVMPECGVKYSEKIEVLEIAGKKVFSVMDNYLAACFDEKVNEEVITAIAKTCPTYFVMRDSSLESDNVADNFMQIFKQYSPETTCKII